MNVSFSSFQVVCYWGTWANYRPEGGDKTCFPNIFLSSALFYFGILFKVLPIFRKVHTGPRGRHPLHTSHLQVAVHSSGWQKLCGGTGHHALDGGQFGFLSNLKVPFYVYL